MTLKITVSLILLLLQIHVIKSQTDNSDSAALNSLKTLWQNVPPSWNGFDPCGDRWEGVMCTGSRVTSITLSSMGLVGTLSGDIQGLSELRILDLSYNKGLTGPLPSAIGSLSKLTSLILVGCSFNGELPSTLGSISQLVFLSLNSNSFSGEIPSSIGKLSNLYWLDLAENRLTGTLPVSNGTTPGLDMLVHTKHFHFGRNQLSGSIPPQILNENMTLLHLLLDNNQLTGNIPETLGLVKTLEVVRLDWNSLSGSIPSNVSNLTSTTDLILSNNQLSGSLPDLTGMDHLSYLDLSNNTFDPSDFPPSIAGLNSLTTLVMENAKIQGSVPVGLFGLPQLQTVVLKKNMLSGTLSLGTASSQLQLVDLQNNNISSYTITPGNTNVQLILVGNPICADTITTQNYCILPQQSNPSYTTPPQNCAPAACDTNEVSSPNCKCAVPYTGTLVFRAPQFSDLQNTTYYGALEQKLMGSFRSAHVTVDSVSLGNISRNPSNYLEMKLQVFPQGQDRFNRTGILSVGFLLSNQTFKPPPYFGPFYFISSGYTNFAAESAARSGKNKLSTAAIIGISVAGGAVLIILLLSVIAVICFRKKKQPNKSTNLPGGISETSWMSAGTTSSNVQFTASRMYSLEEVKKMTNNFSEPNVLGAGAFGKVYRGSVANGQLVAVKRGEQGHQHGGLEFKTEIELLSRVHHKNLVSLLGFCLEKGEQILVYEYVPNGTLKQSLLGKSGVRLDWRRRVKVALGAARGVAYLHELANPPIIHRDIKSNNILLDENLNPKVSDFGLSKPMLDAGKDHITTEVKGTMGYLDPEYYMTQKLNEKSDVYSFGVLMLELITGRSPIDRGKYIVREMRNAIDRAQDLYGLHELLDPSIGLATTLKGFEKYVDLALRCVEELGDDRPMMGEVVKQLEDITEMAGLNPYTDSSGGSATFGVRGSRSLYDDTSLYSRSGPIAR